MKHLLISVTAVAATIACSRAESSDGSADRIPAEQQDRIALAMSGGPVAIASRATIVDFDSGGTARELRSGSNGWLCLPDDPSTPGTDPMCLDEVWQHWMEAYEHKTKPVITRVGVSYMLRGGKAASNDDPFASEPQAGRDWIDDGPHVMLLVPDPDRTLAGLSRDPLSGGPYVMWGGTDYAHVMVPIAPGGR